MAETRRFAGITSRSQLKVANNLGIISRTDEVIQKDFRKRNMELFDSYYENRQYLRLPHWEQETAADQTYVPIRQRQPRLTLAFAKMLTSRITSKLLGSKHFPTMKIEEDPDAQELIRLIIEASQLKAKIIEPMRRMLVAGSVLLRFKITNGVYKIEHYLGKWCFPKFDDQGNLDFVRIRYVFSDEQDRDENGVPKKKWFQLDLSKLTDVLYDNPEFNHETEPVFKVKESVTHGLGFVQAEWFKTSDNISSIDGDSAIEDILGFIDELNYNSSQSSQAVQYNQDPQLAFTNMDADEIHTLIKSSVKGWNLGREGKAEFLESTMNGVEAASNFRESIKLNIQDIARVVMMDPEKIVGHAQSAKALEVLHAPMIELIEELQPGVGRSLTNFVMKMTITSLLVSKQGGLMAVQIPPGFRPKSLNLIPTWPAIFPQTMEDLQKKVGVAVQASSANLISRETGTRWIAKDFDVEDVEEEVRKVNAQPVINPFGGF